MTRYAACLGLALAYLAGCDDGDSTEGETGAACELASQYVLSLPPTDEFCPLEPRDLLGYRLQLDPGAGRWQELRPTARGIELVEGAVDPLDTQGCGLHARARYERVVGSGSNPARLAVEIAYDLTVTDDGEIGGTAAVEARCDQPGGCATTGDACRFSANLTGRAERCGDGVCDDGEAATCCDDCGCDDGAVCAGHRHPDCATHTCLPAGEVPCAAIPADSRIREVEHRIAGALKLDILFVVDDSGSMCEEQANLTRNFGQLSSFIFDELGAAADYRLAVTSPDVHNDGRKGAFLYAPAPFEPSLNCRDEDGNPLAPDTADCDADLPPIVSPGDVDSPAELERRFRCMATLGTNGDGFEKGLEAMRLALSCDGPNAASLASCCPDGPCDATERGFLRPDGVLVVVFLTDEDDCSDPASNLAASALTICRHGADDEDGDGIPDGYLDPSLCPGDPADCQRVECGTSTPSACYEARCLVSRSENSNCEWYRDTLTPVRQYEDFLRGLKTQPQEQILVAAITGEPRFTDDGHPVSYNPGIPPDPSCERDPPHYDPDPLLAACCPEGRCIGRIEPSCSAEGGEAFHGRRYLELANAFGDRGTDLNICTDDFGPLLAQLRAALPTEVADTVCLDAKPVCPEDGAPCVELIGCEGPGCEGVELVVDLMRSDCPGGAAFGFSPQPPSGATVEVRYTTE